MRTFVNLYVRVVEFDVVHSTLTGIFVAQRAGRTAVVRLNVYSLSTYSIQC